MLLHFSFVVLSFILLWFHLLTYLSVFLRLVFRFILNVFFRDIKVHGLSNIPSEGPVIFAIAPHANQMVDPLMVLVTCRRKIGFLAAKKSCDSLVIGSFCKAFNSIPVARPQDMIKPGSGSVYVDKTKGDLVLFGRDSKFTLEVKPKYSIVIGKNKERVEVERIISDTELLLAKPFQSDANIVALSSKDDEGVAGSPYKIIPHVDQSKMFGTVVQRLCNNETVGIFPEGGSHDRPEMLPLKPGVCIMAFETLVCNPESKLVIIPVGLNYFNADKFRSRAVIEYGEPIRISHNAIEEYMNGGTQKRKAVSDLLEVLRLKLKRLSLQAPDFETLVTIQAVNRIYCSEERRLDPDASLRLCRRFADVLEKRRNDSDVRELLDQVKHYNHVLKCYGVRDHQVRATSRSPARAISLLIYRCIQICIIFTISSPMWILGSPLLYLTQSISRSKAIEAKKGSDVKIAGKDVVTTWKLLTALAVTPTLWLFYTIMVYALSLLFNKTSFRATLNASLFFFIYPILCYATILVSDIGLDMVKSLPPLIVAVGNTISSSEPLRDLRKQLREKINAFVQTLGPEAREFDPTIPVSPTKKDRFLDKNETFDEVEAWDALHSQLCLI